MSSQNNTKRMNTQRIKKTILESADHLQLAKGQETRVFHRATLEEQNKVVHEACAYARVIVDCACAIGIPETERGLQFADLLNVPAFEITTHSRVVSASYTHMNRHSPAELREIQKELNSLIEGLQANDARMSQYRGWSNTNARRNEEAMKRCFLDPKFPKQPYPTKLKYVSKPLQTFLSIGGKMHDKYAMEHHVPPGFIYQYWVDRIAYFLERVDKPPLAANTHMVASSVGNAPSRGSMDTLLATLRRNREEVVLIKP